MSIRVALNHKTLYRYNRPVWLSPHVVRLRPAPHCRTPIPAYSLKITPGGTFPLIGSRILTATISRAWYSRRKPTEFSVAEVNLVADMTVINPFDFFLEKYAEEIPFQYDPVVKRELNPYLKKRRRGPLMEALIEEARTEKIRTNDFLVDVNQRIQKRVKYLIRMEPGIQSPEKTLAASEARSCRDSAWLLVQLLRNLGLAARFVSGYLIQLTPDVKSLDGPSGTDNDLKELHAWAEVYLPGGGWVGLDATSGLLAGEGHIPLACSAEPVTAAAISGGFSYDDESIVETEIDREKRKPERQGRLRVFNVRHAHTRRPSRNEAVQRRAMDRYRIAGPSGGQRPESARRAPDHGRRANFRIRRRHGCRRVENGFGRPHEIQIGGHADKASA